MLCADVELKLAQIRANLETTFEFSHSGSPQRVWAVIDTQKQQTNNSGQGLRSPRQDRTGVHAHFKTQFGKEETMTEQ
jgi:hypothetical protein